MKAHLTALTEIQTSSSIDISIAVSFARHFNMRLIARLITSVNVLEDAKPVREIDAPYTQDGINLQGI